MPLDFSRAWFQGKPGERYWLVLTELDMDATLMAPQEDEGGRGNWSYELITQIRTGDIVFHYSTGESAVVRASRAAGPAWPDRVVWGSKAGETTTPYPRPGWILPLECGVPVQPWVSRADVKSAEAAVKQLKADLRGATRGRAVYFPFEVGDKRAPRGSQGYLTKFPAAMLSLFPPLEAAVRALDSRPVGDAPMRVEPGSHGVGTMYREAPENLSVSQADPFTFDPSLVERAHHSHARVQNALARFAREHGWEPRSPAPSEPNYDIAWDTPEGLLVAEVKSTTTANEERQLRVGVGQLLRYRQLMGPRPVRAVLAIERAPADPSWMALCASVQIELVWLGALERLENP